jgi:hypothetical protein
VYQFPECYWHGCHECFPNREYVRLASSKRDNAFLDAGYNFEIGWEHLFTVRYYEDFKKSKTYHIGVHDAYFGGRVEVLRHHYRCNDNEVVRSFDKIPYIQQLC